MPCSVSSCPHQSEKMPGCTLGGSGVTPHSYTLQHDRYFCSLIVASLEIGKILAKNDRVTFRAQSTCMYPSVRPGDVLHIESRTIEEVAVGDVAVCRKEGYLFGHRVIGKRVDNGRPHIVTRPDRSIRGDDGPTYDEDVLGVVTSIERGGKRIKPLPRRHPWPVRLYLTARLAHFESFFALQKWLIALFARIQSGAVYRWLARPWLEGIRAHVTYLVQLPLRAREHLDLYHAVLPDEFDVAKPTWQGRPADCWTLALYLQDTRRPAAWATFVLRPPDCPLAGWAIADRYVRGRYRGFGFTTELMRKADEIFARSGVTLKGSGGEN